MENIDTDKLRQETAEVVGRWAKTPYYDAVEKQALTQWESLIQPFLAGHEIDYTAVLELAVGHGRMTEILLQQAEHVTGVDVLQENIDFCSARLGHQPNLTLLRNDGVTLTGVESDSINFVFCFDSMMHFDSDVVRAYLREFKRILAPGGKAFLHHSNLTRNPGGNFQTNAHARNFMSQALFQHYAAKEGLLSLKSEVIDWGRGDKRVAELDCLSLLGVL